MLVALPGAELSALAFGVKLPVEDSMLGGYSSGHKTHGLAAGLRMRQFAEIEVSIAALSVRGST